MYQQGDKMLEVRELLVKAFATAWKNSDQSTDRDTYINSSITVIDSMQVQPEMIYAEAVRCAPEGAFLRRRTAFAVLDILYKNPIQIFRIQTNSSLHKGNTA